MLRLADGMLVGHSKGDSPNLLPVNLLESMQPKQSFIFLLLCFQLIRREPTSEPTAPLRSKENEKIFDIRRLDLARVTKKESLPVTSLK